MLNWENAKQQEMKYQEEFLNKERKRIECNEKDKRVEKWKRRQRISKAEDIDKGEIEKYQNIKDIKNNKISKI